MINLIQIGHISIDPNTLYYTFSTIPQMLGVVAALLAAFVLFRINRLEEYLIGDGQAVLNRKDAIGERLNKMQWCRLLDAIARKSIYEIKAILKILSEKEKEEGLTKVTNPTGAQALYEDRFCATFSLIADLKYRTRLSIVFAIIAIIFSLISLALVDLISICYIYAIISLAINILMTIITLILAYRVIHLGLMKKTFNEAD